MLDLEPLEFLSTYSEEVSMTDVNLLAKHEGDAVVVPIRRLGHLGVCLMTLCLAAIATPLYYLVSTSLEQDAPSNINLAFWTLVCFVAWILAVAGPMALHYLIPVGPWYLDHILKYDRAAETLSFLSGKHRWHRSRIRYLIALSGSRKEGKVRETELQICIGDTKPFETFLLSQSAKGDPERAFGAVIRTFSTAMQVPAYLVEIQRDGTRKMVEINNASLEETKAK